MKVVHTVVLFAALTDAATCLFFKWYFMMKNNAPWADALKFCRNNFTDMWSVNMIQEDVSLDSTFFPQSTFWIGLKGTSQPKGNYTKWTDESALTYTNWAPQQTIVGDTDHCVVMQNASWYERLCTYNYYHLCYLWKPYVVVVQEMKTWHEALKHCRTFYTDLISMNTLKDQNAINVYSRSVQTAKFWTGLRFLNGAWFWVNEQTLGNLVSLPSCPVHNLRCGARRTGDHVFENIDCEEKMNFICYHYR